LAPPLARGLLFGLGLLAAGKVARARGEHPGPGSATLVMESSA
jgi:hypothetical protein